MGELERSIALDQFSHFLGCSRRQGWLPKRIGKHKSCLTIRAENGKNEMFNRSSMVIVHPCWYCDVV
ncbi:hypothetical protein TNCV_3491341 [Trichonephila clavipes]|nr:hypothetical protein TNCV_3491341 [Trichonephila clavipes]